jgi:hypothetical protein
MWNMKKFKDETLARARREGKYNIKNVNKERGSYGGDWIQVAKSSAQCRTLVNPFLRRSSATNSTALLALPLCAEASLRVTSRFSLSSLGCS